MSDASPGATAVMEPQGSGGAPSTPTTARGAKPPQPRGVPAWLVVVLVLLAALLAGGGAYLLLRGPTTPPGQGTAVTTSTEPATGAVMASTTPTAVVPPPAPTSVKPRAVTTVREPAIVKSVWADSAGVYHIKVDYVQWLTGAAAAAAATAHGDESPPPNDYYIVNDSPLLRTFTLPSTAIIKVLDWGGASGTTLTQITRAQFRSVLLGSAHPEYTDGTFWLTVVGNDHVTKVIQQYRP